MVIPRGSLPFLFFKIKEGERVLRDSAVVMVTVMLGITLIIIITNYFLGDYKQNTVVQGITETVRVAAYENTDDSSRVERGELYVVRDEFEESFKEKIEGNNVVGESGVIGKEGDIEYKFEYLPVSEDEPLKGIRVKMDDGEQEYQATVQVDISQEE